MIFAVRLVNIRERHIIVGWSLQKKIKHNSVVKKVISAFTAHLSILARSGWRSIYQQDDVTQVNAVFNKVCSTMSCILLEMNSYYRQRPTALNCGLLQCY